jgi:hypothetical protein
MNSPLIQCTQKDGETVLISIFHIIAVFPNGKGSIISLTGENSVGVQETLDHIQDLITGVKL